MSANRQQFQNYDRIEFDREGLECISDSDFLAAPIRFVWHMLLWAAFLLTSPFLLITVLMLGVRIMSADEIWLTKVLLVVLGPFALILWWIVVRRVRHAFRAKCLISRRSQTGDDYTNAELLFLAAKPQHFRNFVLLIVSLSGSASAATVFQGAGNMQFFVWVLAGIFSPTIIVAVCKVLFGFLRSLPKQ